MPKFLVVYLVPHAVVAQWKATAPDTREAAERKMRDEWGAWMRVHGEAVTGTEAAGRTKTVTPDGVKDTTNDIMLTAFVEAESHAAAAAMFEGHPHLQIPQSSIEIMELRPMGAP